VDINGFIDIHRQSCDECFIAVVAATVDRRNVIVVHAYFTHTTHVLIFMVNRILRIVMFHPVSGHRSSFPNTVIVILDRSSNVNITQTLSEARQLQELADVFVIGVNDNSDYQELLVGLADVILVGHKSLIEHNFR